MFVIDLINLTFLTQENQTVEKILECGFIKKEYICQCSYDYESFMKRLSLGLNQNFKKATLEVIELIVYVLFYD